MPWADRTRKIRRSLRKIIERISLGIRISLQVLEQKMFHEVKIFDKTGKVKKVFPSKKLSKEYWNTFFEMGKPTKNKGKKGRKKEPKVVDYDDENLSSDV